MLHIYLGVDTCIVITVIKIPIEPSSNSAGNYVIITEMIISKSTVESTV